MKAFAAGVLLGLALLFALAVATSPTPATLDIGSEQ